jgi:pyridinium-3,5-biscarboxylic acid mononucleotide sulfurtransferase
LSEWTDPELVDRRERLLQILRGYGRLAVAYSGGVDSAVVAKAAQVALGDAAIAVTAVSESLAQGELEEATELATRIGIAHRVIRTEEFADPNYLRNNSDRCYFCKSELYGRLEGLMGVLGVDAIASGANLDDQGDHRPGMKAAGEHNVKHPLQEAGLTKAHVRDLARAWGLPTWDKPATPCLSSRIAYGEDVTPERVRMIDAAEGWLRRQGLRLLRVRYHKGDLARIEVPVEELPRLADPEVRKNLIPAFRELGFKFVTLDLEGFRSGSLNTLIPLDGLLKPAPIPAAKATTQASR